MVKQIFMVYLPWLYTFWGRQRRLKWLQGYFELIFAIQIEEEFPGMLLDLENVKNGDKITG